MINLSYLYSLGLSLLLSGLIGYERESQEKPAGLRDTMLVCFGATMFTVISLILRDTPNLGTGLRYDLGRIIAYTIVGIGFLGSGVIIQMKGRVEGITTASMLWAIVGVGLLCGLQEYILAVVCAGCIYFILKLKHIKVKIEMERKKNGKKHRSNTNK
jgi:putative Mg2+ transporter-C (MgtC) family protein